MVQSIKNLIAAVLVAISGFLLWAQVLPKYELTSALKLTIIEKQELLSLRTDIARSVNDLNEEYSKRYAELQRLALVVPETKNISEVISMTEAMFSQTGNILGEFVVTNSSALDEALQKVFLDIASTGSYENMLNLLSAIESNIRLFDITSLSISEDAESTTGELDFNIKGDIYWLDQTEIGSSETNVSAGSGAGN